MYDTYKRKINYMRISVTDRCNLRCIYCMPEGIHKVSMSKILTYEQITSVCRAAVSCGITRFKITGGEPLVRLGVSSLIADIKNIPGCEEVTLTTNGTLLDSHLSDLSKAGLDGINVSLDTLKPKTFKKITGFDLLGTVLSGIDKALSAGIRVKINAVLQKDLNEDEWEDLILLAKDKNIDVRFIEMMPIGYGKSVPGFDNKELEAMIRSKYPDAEDDARCHGNGPAVYIHIPEWRGSIGFISAIHGKFCGNCNRIRLTSQGKLKPCLCYADTLDIMDAFDIEDRIAQDARIKEYIMNAIEMKQEEHHFDEPEKITETLDMIDIGG